MLRFIEYGLLAVSLLVVIGLVVSGSRSGAQSVDPDSDPDNPEPTEQKTA